ncbi:MAG TPA: hypothetical protein PKC43_01680 [Phycisphaerales bacterium]|nr:hypothetical protein [Phycisphaerales bacterium]HMP36135.1 hypothetical protein [Phycisphaerales bacterium]
MPPARPLLNRAPRPRRRAAASSALAARRSRGAGGGRQRRAESGGRGRLGRPVPRSAVVVRLLLALLMVWWSPGWCCCGIRIALDRTATAAVLNISATTEGGAASDGGAFVPRCPRCETALRSAERSRAEGGQRDGVPDDGAPASDPGDCDCHAHVRAAAPGAAVALPSSSTAPAPPAALPGVADLVRGCAERRALPSLSGARGEPPPRGPTPLDLRVRLSV